MVTVKSKKVKENLLHVCHVKSNILYIVDRTGLQPYMFSVGVYAYISSSCRCVCVSVCALCVCVDMQVKDGVANSWDEEAVWRSELYLSAGILALGLLSLLAVASLPSVGNALNWREFTFIQVSLQML